MKRWVVLAASLACLGTAAPAFATDGPEVRPFSFVVPVNLTKLHKNLTLVRVRCWVLANSNWRGTGGAALGEGVSGPEDTQRSGSVRVFSGDVTVNVPLREPRQDPAAAHSYRCQVELYDSAGRIWGDAAQIDKRYPINTASLQVAETGGLLGP